MPKGTCNVYIIGFCGVMMGIVLIVVGCREVNVEGRLKALEQRLDDIERPRPVPIPATGRVPVWPPGEDKK